MATYEKIHLILRNKYIVDTFKRIFQFGGSYTSIYINGKLVAEGGRDPFTRLNLLPLDFKNKTVIDLGCNCGGMLFALSDKIKKGIGYEINEEAVNNANTIKENFNIKNLDFFVKDLEKLETIEPIDIDIMFMLSISRWVRTWKEVIKKLDPKTLVFEAHGKPHEVEDQVNFINQHFSKVVHLSTYREQRLRHLYICNA